MGLVITYLDHQKEARRQHFEQAKRDTDARMFEARKPFNEMQLELYAQVAKVTGEIVTTTDFANPKWGENVRRFYQLFWTELSMVEDHEVKKEMEKFSTELRNITRVDDYKSKVPHLRELQQASYRLASALRASIASSWSLVLAAGSEAS
jgi:hypothetical protein